MKVTLTASTAAKIVVWKKHDLYHARRLELLGPPQVCLELDLFEVIAELAELDLEQPEQAAEATALSAQVQARLDDPSAASDGSPTGTDEDESASFESAP